MFKRSLGACLLVASMAVTSPAWANAIITFEPSNLEAGVPTPVTISVTDSTGSGFGIGQVSFGFSVPAGLTVGNFGWLSGLNSGSLYFATTGLPNPFTILLVPSSGVDVPANGTIPIAGITVTADAGAADGQTFSLPTGIIIQEDENLSSLVVKNDSSAGVFTIGPVVPEPATLALLVVGGLATLHRRRRS